MVLDFHITPHIFTWDLTNDNGHGHGDDHIVWSYDDEVNGEILTIL